jgi:hypothetical protein
MLHRCNISLPPFPHIPVPTTLSLHPVPCSPDFRYVFLENRDLHLVIFVGPVKEGDARDIAFIFLSYHTTSAICVHGEVLARGRGEVALLSSSAHFISSSRLTSPMLS